MSIYAIILVNYMFKKQKSTKGLKFSDRKNAIDSIISTGVDSSSNDPDNYDDVNEDDVIQYDIIIDEDDSNADTASNNVNGHRTSTNDLNSNNGCNNND